MVLHMRSIGPNTASNGVWLHKSVHQPMHTNAYFANVNMVVGKYRFNAMLPTSRLVEDLARVGQLLQKGQLPL